MHTGRRGSARYTQDRVKVTMWHLMDSESPSGRNRIDGCDERAMYVFILKGTDCWPPKWGQQAKVYIQYSLGILALALCSAVLCPTSIPLETCKVYVAYHCYRSKYASTSTLVKVSHSFLNILYMLLVSINIPVFFSFLILLSILLKGLAIVEKFTINLL